MLIRDPERRRGNLWFQHLRWQLAPDAVVKEKWSSKDSTPIRKPMRETLGEKRVVTLAFLLDIRKHLLDKGNKLLDEGERLNAKGCRILAKEENLKAYKLLAEGNRLRSEGYKLLTKAEYLWADATANYLSHE